MKVDWDKWNPDLPKRQDDEFLQWHKEQLERLIAEFLSQLTQLHYVGVTDGDRLEQ